MGVVAVHLDIQPRRTILDLLQDRSRVDTTLLRAVMERVGENLDVLAGPHEAIAQAAIPFADVRPILDTARKMADLVVLDVHCAYDDLFFETLDYARQVVLVGEQKLSSVRAMNLVRQAIARTNPQKELAMVINRYDAKLVGFTTEFLLKPLGAEKLRTIPEDGPAILAASNRGCPLRLQKPNALALADIDALAESLVGSSPPGGEKDIRPYGFLRRLGRPRWVRAKP
jgi:pilus assembly protein CpaE